jgi:hypothetical protein
MATIGSHRTAAQPVLDGCMSEEHHVKRSNPTSHIVQFLPPRVAIAVFGKLRKPLNRLEWPEVLLQFKIASIGAS